MGGFTDPPIFMDKDMTVTPVDIDLFLPKPEIPRSVGVHVSNIIRCIAVETGILRQEVAEDLKLIDIREFTDPVQITRILIGMAWDQFYIPIILGGLGVKDHPRELEVDGIYMSPDGESLDVIFTDHQARVVPVVHEVKTTYKSINTVVRGGDLTSQWMWLAQIKAYCRALNTRLAVLHVLFLCGDYSYPISPKNLCWEIEFTQEEIDSNWNLMTEYRDYKEREAAILGEM